MICISLNGISLPKEKKKDTYFQLHKSLEIETKDNKVNTYQNLKYIVKKKSIYNRF